jgi:CubicO group peptidase (beta-lactamase class C family)
MSNDLARAAALALEHGARGLGVADPVQAVFEAGEVSAVVNCRSIRKSLLSAVVGRAVAAGTVDLDATLKELGIDDTQPALTVREQRARVRDLLTCRSDVYHPANHAGEPAGFTTLPARESRRPGEWWFFYNNWDFNALGTIVNLALGRSLFDEFAEAIAQPAEMHDFDPEQQRYAWQAYSEHPTYSSPISTRDLPRFGQLYVRWGNWNGSEIIAPAWVAQSTAVQTVTSRDPATGASRGSHTTATYSKERRCPTVRSPRTDWAANSSS